MNSRYQPRPAGKEPHCLRRRRRSLDCHDSRIPQHRTSRLGSLFPHPAADDRLVVDESAAGEAGNRLRRGNGRGQGSGAVHREDGVHLRVGRDRGQGRNVALGRRVPDNVDRVGARPIVRQHLVEGSLRVRGDARQFQPKVEQVVDRHHPGAAAIGDDGNPAARHWTKTAGDFRSRKELLEALDADHARTQQRRLDDGVGRRKGAGMSHGCLRRLAVAPGLYRNHRLEARRGPGGRHELAWLRDGFQVDEDGLGFPVEREPVDAVAYVDIAHVSERDQLREPDILARGPVDDRRHDGAGLRNQPDVTARRHQVRKAGVEPDMRRDRANRIGPYDAHDRRTRGIEHCLLLFCRQSRGNDDCGPATSLRQFSDDTRHRSGRRCHNPKVGRLREIEGGTVAALITQLVVFRIDQEHLSTEPAGTDVCHEYGAHGPDPG